MFPRGKVSATIAAGGVTLFRLTAALCEVLGRQLPCWFLFPGVPTAKRRDMLSKVAGARSVIELTFNRPSVSVVSFSFATLWCLSRGVVLELVHCLPTRLLRPNFA